MALEMTGRRSTEVAPESAEGKEDIEYTDLVIVRHGPRGTDGILAAHASEKTSTVASRVLEDLKKWFDIGNDVAVAEADVAKNDNPESIVAKAIGSSVKAKLPGGGFEQRALKTAEEAAQEMKDALHADILPSKPRPHMSYEAVRSDKPYHHVAVYNRALGEAMVAAGHLTREDFDAALSADAHE